MKKNKLALRDLKVKSFVTDISNNANQVVGGKLPTDNCFTGIYPTIPVEHCVNNGSNGYNCPTEGGALCNFN